MALNPPSSSSEFASFWCARPLSPEEFATMTTASLKSHTCKDLAAMAKENGVQGWHSMRKDQLIKALVQTAKSKSRASQKKKAAKPTARQSAAAESAAKTSKNGSRRSGSRRATPTVARPKSPRVRKRLEEIKTRLAEQKNLAASGAAVNGETVDRLVLMVRDAYWLHAHWELTGESVERAKASMGHLWHTAKPVLRLLEIGGSTEVNTASRLVREIEIHGGVSNWYIDVSDPPKTFRVEIGYLADDRTYYTLARSNTVTTPTARGGDIFDQHWQDVAENYDSVYALSKNQGSESQDGDLQELLEERLGRPMGSPTNTRFGNGAQALLQVNGNFPLEVDAELVIYGYSKPNSYVTVKGEPVEQQDDGSFTMRFNLPDKRQVIPVVAHSGDGVEQRTILLAVDRNTKVMEPVVRKASG